MWNQRNDSEFANEVSDWVFTASLLTFDTETDTNPNTAQNPFLLNLFKIYLYYEPYCTPAAMNIGNTKES